MRVLHIATIQFVLIMALASIFSSAQANCTRNGPDYRPELNETINVTMICTRDGAVWFNPPGPGYTMTGISIASRPQSGKLVVYSPNKFHYYPRQDGSDSFSIKQCASVRGSSGCATINYDVTNNNIGGK